MVRLSAIVCSQVCQPEADDDLIHLDDLLWHPAFCEHTSPVVPRHLHRLCSSNLYMDTAAVDSLGYNFALDIRFVMKNL